MHQHDPASDMNLRISALERGTRRWRLVAAAALAAAIAPWVLGAAGRSEPAGEVRATSLTLVNAEGATYGQITLRDGAPVLTMNHQGRHVTLTLEGGNAGLAAGSGDGVVFAGVSDGSAYFNARGKDLLTGVYAGVGSALDAAVRTYSGDMRSVAHLGVGPDGSATVSATDPATGTSSLPGRGAQ